MSTSPLWKKTVKQIPGAEKAYLGARHFPRRASQQLRYHQQFQEFKRLQATNPRFALHWDERFMVLNEDTPHTEYDRHYLYFTAWALRAVAEIAPKEHVDISSTLTFCAALSAFLPVKFYDYRPADLKLSNLSTGQANLTQLSFANDSISSLSCMHVVEHVGLGRYGDPISPDSDLIAMRELQRVLAKGGNLLFVVPIGQPRIQYNAHRIYAYRQIIEAFPDLTLKEFTLIEEAPSNNGPIRHATEAQADAQFYGCGCFWFQKKH